MPGAQETAAQREKRLAICRRAQWRCEWIGDGDRCFRAAPHYRMIVSVEGKCLCAFHALDTQLARAITESRGAQIAVAHKILGVSDMATPVTGIGAIVRDAKASLSSARASVERLKKSVDNLGDTVKQVDAMRDEVETAHEDLKKEIHGVTNGPPSEEPLQ